MSKPGRVFSLLAMASCLLLCFSCDASPRLYVRDSFAMDTTVSVSVYSDSKEAADNASSAAIDLINRYDSLLSISDEESDVYKINHSGGKPVSVSGDTVSILETAEKISKLSGGLFDATIYPVVKAWGFTQNENRVPPKDELDELLKCVDWTKLEINNNSVKLPENFMIDLGGIAKGYISGKAAELLKEKGVYSAIVTLGGSVQTIGLKPDGSKWEIGIRNPNSPDQVVGTIRTGEKCIVTSGIYERKFVSEGITYHHIISPETGCPSDSEIVSATIISDNPTEADALSTAVLIAGESSVRQMMEFADFDAILITKDGEVIVFGEYEFTFTDNNKESFRLRYVM